MLFSFYSNFTEADLICKVVARGESVAPGAGATIQFNGDDCIVVDGARLSLQHSGRVTVKAALGRAKLVEAIRDSAPEADDALGGLDAAHGWPLRLGSLQDLAALLQRLEVYAFAVEQAKRSIRREPLLPTSVAPALPITGVAPAELTGQGFTVDAAARRLIELHAMEAAKRHFSKVWPNVVDTSASHPYDLRCSKRHRELRVEVKGTTGDGRTIMLTRNEVAHARTFYPHVSLFVLANIRLDRAVSSGTLRASGGAVRLLEPWDVDAAGLIPLTYTCVLPPENS